MLKIEVIKFEAQDVITASVACICGNWKASNHLTQGGICMNSATGDICWAENHDH